MIKAVGNLINRVMEGRGTRMPEVGMGATMTHFSDRTAGTIVRVDEYNFGQNRKFRVVYVQEDKATRTDTRGQCESQDYSYERNPKGEIKLFRCEIHPQDGRQIDVWREVSYNPKTNKYRLNGTDGLMVGERDEYYDYGF